ncbi:MAG: Trm112 family protein [Actinomycetota bacterium]|nr:Trm112 family protein [Actinomycetota bacterium]
MPLDEKLLEILACPNCRGEVEYLQAENVIVCRGECRYRYPVRDDIPVMLIDEAERPSDAPGTAS